MAGGKVLQVEGQQALPVDFEDVPEGQLEHWKIRQWHLERQREINAPFEAICGGISLIISVAVAIFSQMALLPSLFLGAGTLLILTGIKRLVFKEVTLLNVHRQAANALNTPGFYEFGALNQINFYSAEMIVKSYQLFIRTSI